MSTDTRAGLIASGSVVTFPHHNPEEGVVLQTENSLNVPLVCCPKHGCYPRVLKDGNSTTVSVELEAGGEPLFAERRSFWNTACHCHFSCIPDEILLFNVFSYLEQRELCEISLVCRRWNFLAGDRLLWRKLDFTRLPPLKSEMHLVGDRAVNLFSKRFGSSVESVKLCNCHGVSKSGLISLIQNAHELRELHLCSLTSVSDDLVVRLVKTAPHLEKLSLYGCIQVSDVSMYAIGRHCKNLRELSLRGCTKVSDRGLAMLPDTLEELNVCGCRRLSSRGLLHFVETRGTHLRRVNLHGTDISDEVVEAISTHCLHTETLHLSSTDPFGGASALSGSSLFHLSRLRGLKCLNLQGSSNMTDESLRIFSLSSRGLERLNLGGCYRFTDIGISHLAMNAHRLTHLSMFQCYGVTDVALKVMAEHMPLLQHLDIHSCVKITDVSLSRLLILRRTPKAKKTLSSFSSSSSLSRSTPRIVEVGSREGEEEDDGPLDMDMDVKKERKREEEKMSEVDRIRHTSRFHCFPILRSLDVGGCPSVSRGVVKAVGAARPELRLLH